jgi:2-C-methyl-D-erythritol 4-phosphate cytidylyltransferase
MKKNKQFVSAVIVAAGRGSRMNMDINKQYIEVCGKPVLARTLEVFEESGLIDEIVLVVNEQDLVFCKQYVINRYRYDNIKALVVGGKERQNSVYYGLKEVSPECDIVLIHDGARPFFPKESIQSSIDAANEFGAACVAVPVKDTIKAAGVEMLVKETLDRSALWSIQTPQTFRHSLLIEAHTKALEDGFTGTDDSSLVERMGIRTKLVMGSYNNIKITTKEDIAIAEAIVQSI